MLRNAYNLAIYSLSILCVFLLFYNLKSSAAAAYFLDLPRGESELLDTGSAKILFDAGYGNRIVSVLDKIGFGKHIDIGIISTLEPDYLDGYNFLIQSYGLGAILWNGRLDQNSSSPEWSALLTEIQKQKIPMVPVGAGDVIHSGNTDVKILSPTPASIKNDETADTSLVARVDSPGMALLLAGGVDSNVESSLVKTKLGQADILKVPSHGSKNSTSQNFLNAVKPKISLISTGGKVLPDVTTLSRLKSANSLVFQTGLSGTIKIASQSGKLQVFTEK